MSAQCSGYSRSAAPHWCSADFSKYLATSKQYQIDYAKKTNLMPSLTEAYDDEFFKTPEWQAFLEQLKIAKGRPGTPAWPEINDALTAGIQEALAGQKTPKQALDDAQKSLTDMAAQNQ
jgi:ABC-type glycerol-3-phosphate transport system substrate-binding protein